MKNTQTRISLWLPVLLSLLITACDAGFSGEAFVVEDSSGIQIVENDPTPESIQEWQLADVPVLSIGDPAPTPDYELHGVYYARSFPDGRIAISMNLETLRIFDEEGRFLVSIGRDGEGPGEFSFLWDAHPLDNDEIRTLDIRNRRTAFFDARTGELLDEIPLVTWFNNPNGVYPLRDFRYAGLFATQGGDYPRIQDREVVVHRRDGTGSDTIGTLDASHLPDSPPGTREFEAYFSSAAAGDHVWAGWQGKYEIRRFQSDSGLDRIIRTNSPPEPVTEEMKARPGGAAHEGGSARRRIYPDHLPYFDRMRASPGGWLWVRKYPSPLGSGEYTWDIFDPDGRQVALIRFPANVKITELGDDYVLGVFPNELDIQRVQKFEILRHGY